MLEIIINRQPVDLPDAIQIALTIENPFMLQDRIPTPYSLNFDLPPSPRNLLLFKYPNRITAHAVYTELPCIIQFQAINIAVGVIKLNNYDKTLKVNFKGVGITDALRKMLFEQTLEAFEFGTGTTPPSTIDFTTGPGKAYYDLWQDAKTYPNAYPFANGPIRIAEGEWILQERSHRPGQTPVVIKGRPDYSSTSMYFDYFNPTSGRFTLDDGADVYHAPIYPFPYVHYLFDKIFGDSLRNNPFKTGDLAKLVTIGSYHPNFVRPDYESRTKTNGAQFDSKPGVPGYPYHVYLETRLPKMEAGSFVREILKVVCGTLFTRKGKFEIKLNDEILSSNQVEEWDHKLINTLVSTNQPKQVYNYGYADDSSDPTLLADQTVDSVQEIYDYAISDGAQQDFMVRNTGERYSKSNEEGEIFISGLSHNFGKFDSDDTEGEKFEMNPSISPLPMTIDYFWTQKNLANGVQYPDNMYFWHVPLWSGDRYTRPENVNILFYHGIKQGFRNEDTYPLLSPYNYDLQGNKVADFNLGWEGAEGLLNTYHREFREWVEKDKMRISGTFLLSALDLHQLDLSVRKHIRGRHFFVEKISLTIRKNRIDPAQIDLLEA